MKTGEKMTLKDKNEKKKKNEISREKVLKNSQNFDKTNNKLSFL